MRLPWGAPQGRQAERLVAAERHLIGWAGDKLDSAGDRL
jgi:hypothetical protein